MRFLPLAPAEYLGIVEAELASARERFPPMASPHEAYAVILEEVEEFWKEVQAGNRNRARAEAVQIAAMAVRFLLDCPAEDVR